MFIPGGLGRNRKRRFKSNWTIRYFVSSLDKSLDEKKKSLDKASDSHDYPPIALDRCLSRSPLVTLESREGFLQLWVQKHEQIMMDTEEKGTAIIAEDRGRFPHKN